MNQPTDATDPVTPSEGHDDEALPETPAGSSQHFSFTAQSLTPSALVGSGRPHLSVSGNITATGPDSAQRQLSAMGLRVVSLEPSASAGRSRSVRGGDFLAFNQQLAYLTEAGLPVEQGLRLIARDLKAGRLSATIQQVADELKAGKSLPEAFSAHRGAFPPLYGAVLQAGIKTGNLPAVLMGLGRHLELLQRLQAAVWRSIAYPLVVFFGVLVMLGVLGAVIVPQFREIFEDFDTALPPLTEFVLWVSEYMPFIVAGLLGLGAALLIFMTVLRASGRGQLLFDKVLWVPLLGPAIRRNMLCRWCDALRLGLNAGLDLPGALEMACDALGSAPLKRDTDAMVATLQKGQPIRQNVSLRFVPEAVPAAIELASHADDLPGMLEKLSAMYQQQAEARVAALHMVLGPIMLIIVAAIIGVVITAMFLPLIRVMQSVL